MFQLINQHHQKMLKGLNNNNASPFSMENLLSRGKLSPENLDINDEDQEDNYKNKTEINNKNCLSPSETENDRLSPVERADLYFRFNGFKNRICSNCGRMDCNFLHCRMNSGEIVKDNKPVLKFSVSAILGDEPPTRSLQNGKCAYLFLGDVSYLTLILFSKLFHQ